MTGKELIQNYRAKRSSKEPHEMVIEVFWEKGGGRRSGAAGGDGEPGPRQGSGASEPNHPCRRGGRDD